MNYSLTDLPDSGDNPLVYMDIELKGEILGRISIKLFRDVFPAGVENFVGIVGGKTYQVTKKGFGSNTYTKQTRRTYDGSKFFKLKHNNYLIAGDIYHNDGTGAGTIYQDEPIPGDFGEMYIPHDIKGLVSLVPYYDEATEKLFYDSTFMITLDDAKPNNVLSDLDENQIVIGQVYSGMDVIDKMNILIKPYAGRKYPNFIIRHAGVIRRNNKQKSRPVKVNNCLKFTRNPIQIN